MYLLMGDKTEKTLQFRIRKTNLFSKTIYLVIFIDTSEQRKIQSLEQRAKFKQLMLGQISHELRTPLNASVILLQCANQDPRITEDMKNKYLKPVFYCCDL